MRLKRLLQFRLRTLLGVLLAASLLLGAWNLWLRPYQAQQEALAEIQEKAEHVATREGEPAWLRRFVNDETFRDVTHLSYHNVRATDEDMAPLAKLPRLRRLSLHGTKVTDAGIKYAANSNQFDTVSLKRTLVSDAGLAYFADSKQMTMLQLSHTQITGAGLVHLKEMHRLRHLEMAGLNVRDDDLAHLSHLTQLEYLDLNNTKITGPGLAHLAQLKRLRELRVSGPLLRTADIHDFPVLQHLEVQGSGVRNIRVAELPRLASLFAIVGHLGEDETSVTLVDLPQLNNLRWVANRTDHFRAENLPRLPSQNFNFARIKSIKLRNLPLVKGVSCCSALVNTQMLTEILSVPSVTNVTLMHSAAPTDDKRFWTPRTRTRPAGGPIDLSPLAARPDLTELNLHSSYIDGDTFEHVAKLHGLRKLILNSVNIEDEHVAHLVELSNLEVLILPHTEITDRAAASLARLTNLRELHLDNTQIGNAALAELAQLPNLQVLRLKNTKLDDRGLASIGKMPELTHLDLQYTNITDAGLPHLSRLGKLNWVSCDHTQVTSEAAERLKKALPNARISYPYRDRAGEIDFRLLNGPSIRRGSRPRAVVISPTPQDGESIIQIDPEE